MRPSSAQAPPKTPSKSLLDDIGHWNEDPGTMVTGKVKNPEAIGQVYTYMDQSPRVPDRKSLERTLPVKDHERYLGIGRGATKPRPATATYGKQPSMQQGLSTTSRPVSAASPNHPSKTGVSFDGSMKGEKQAYTEDLELSTRINQQDLGLIWASSLGQRSVPGSSTSRLIGGRWQHADPDKVAKMRPRSSQPAFTGPRAATKYLFETQGKTRATGGKATVGFKEVPLELTVPRETLHHTALGYDGHATLAHMDGAWQHVQDPHLSLRKSISAYNPIGPFDLAQSLPWSGVSLGHQAVAGAGNAKLVGSQWRYVPTKMNIDPSFKDYYGPLGGGPTQHTYYGRTYGYGFSR